MTTKQRSEETLTPDEARAAVQRLRDELAAVKVDTEKGRATLADIEGHVGDKLLDAKLAKDDVLAAKINADLADARLAVETADKVVAALGKRITEAERDVLRADARALRAEARRLWEDAKPRLEKTHALLNALHEAENVFVRPEPWVHPSGAFPSGSWKRTKTGDILAAIVDLESQAIGLEARAGLTSPPSILAGVADAAWHLGHRGTIESAVPIKVGGSLLDGAAASLRGERTAPPDDGFASLRAELKAKGVQKIHG